MGILTILIIAFVIVLIVKLVLDAVQKWFNDKWDREDKEREKQEEDRKRKEEEMKEPHSPLARSGEVPYHVAIQSEGVFLCSGSMISKKHVLTVAHCVARFYKDESKIRVYINCRAVPECYVHYSVYRINSHPFYFQERFQNDVAVLELADEISTSAFVKVISLPENKTSLQGLTLFVSGYGPFSAPTMPRLYDFKRFNMTYTQGHGCSSFSFMEDYMFCAVPAPRYEGCLANDGSPATVNKKYVVGIYLRNGYYGCGARSAELFLDLSRFLEFIKTAMV